MNKKINKTKIKIYTNKEIEKKNVNKNQNKKTKEKTKVKEGRRGRGGGERGARGGIVRVKINTKPVCYLNKDNDTCWAKQVVQDVRHRAFVSTVWEESFVR